MFYDMMSLKARAKIVKSIILTAFVLSFVEVERSKGAVPWYFSIYRRANTRIKPLLPR